jgi:hypothetical protein
MLFQAGQNMVLFLVGSHILLKDPILLFAMVIGVSEIMHSIGCHMINIVWSKEMVVETKESNPTISGPLSCLGISPCLMVMK